LDAKSGASGCGSEKRQRPARTTGENALNRILLDASAALKARVFWIKLLQLSVVVGDRWIEETEADQNEICAHLIELGYNPKA
jgi:hypothetical protein